MIYKLLTLSKTFFFNHLISLKKVSAQVDVGDRNDIVSNPVGAFEPIARVLENLILSLRNVTIAIGLLFIIIGGILYITSIGNPEKAGQARKTITWATIAILAAITLWILLLILANLFGFEGIQDDGGIRLNLEELD